MVVQPLLHLHRNFRRLTRTGRLCVKSTRVSILFSCRFVEVLSNKIHWDGETHVGENFFSIQQLIRYRRHVIKAEMCESFGFMFHSIWIGFHNTIWTNNSCGYTRLLPEVTLWVIALGWDRFGFPVRFSPPVILQIITQGQLLTWQYLTGNLIHHGDRKPRIKWIWSVWCWRILLPISLE